MLRGSVLWLFLKSEFATVTQRHLTVALAALSGRWKVQMTVAVTARRG